MSIEERPVLHLPDGLAGSEVADGHLARLEACEKIVLGRSGQVTEGGVAAGIQSWPPGLKVLHLWGLKGLTELPPFEACPELETIDVTGCSDLTALPPIAHLAGLEWLDCKGCGGLTELPDSPPVGLQFLYLDGCRTLTHEQIVGFLNDLGREGETPKLVELDLSRTGLARLPKFTWPGYWDDEELDPSDHRARWESRRWLEKIVLEDCERLSELALPLENLPNLRHLNLAGCKRLDELPTLPVVAAYPAPWPQKVMQYLRTDSTKIERHARVDVRPRHRREGHPETHRNSAESLLALQHFSDPVDFPECRMMVLGNSMAGKTTLLSRLMYGVEGYYLPGYVEPEGGRDRWKPAEGIESTHPIQCPVWRVKLDRFDDPSSVHVWDYGGQHKYHRSHRNFVREGTLFLLVWRHPDRVLPATDSERDKQLREDEGVPRTLEYWLDYIVDSEACTREKLRDHVVIVCTQAGGLSEETLAAERRRQLGRYADLGLQDNLTVEAVDLDGGGSDRLNQWLSFYSVLRDRLDRAIDANGSRVPRFFADAAERVRVDRQWCETERERDPELVDPVDYQARAFPDDSTWLATLADVRGAAVESPHVQALTENLHETGSVFWLRPPADPSRRHVIVDQGLALDWVYRLLDSNEARSFQAKCRDQRGWFGVDDLVIQRLPGERESKRLIESDWQRDRALQMMEQCRLILSCGDRFLATEDALLPDLSVVHTEVHGRRHAWRENGAFLARRLQGEGQTVGEGTFQDFRAWTLGALREFVDPATFHLYRGGFQVEVDGGQHWRQLDPERRRGWPDRFLLELAWVPDHPGAQGGVMYAYLYASNEEQAATLWGTLSGQEGLWTGKQSPLAARIDPLDSDDRPLLLLDAAASGIFPFGISCRGTNAVAPELYDHLMALAPPRRTFYYRGQEVLEDFGEGHTESVLSALGASAVIVLMIDRDYLEPSAENRYCLMELAMAAFRFDPDNWARLEDQMRPRVLKLCRDRLGLLYHNAERARAQARARTVLFVDPGFDRRTLAQGIAAGLEALRETLEESCAGLGEEDHPLIHFKRELVNVLLDEGGAAQFYAQLVDSEADLSDLDQLKERLESLAEGIDRG